MPASTDLPDSPSLLAERGPGGEVIPHGLGSRDRAQRCRAARLHLDALSARFTKARARSTNRDRAVLRALVRSFTEPPEPSQ